MSAHAPSIAGPKELQTRFIYPFSFERDRLKEARAALGDVRLPGRHEQTLRVWECDQPHELYKEELLKPVAEFLFQDSGVVGCAHMQIAGGVANRWFNGLHVSLPGGREYLVRLLSPLLIELFLSSHGVGFLSVALSPDPQALDFDRAKEFNYRLSQLRPSTTARLRLPHPSEDQDRWARLSPAERDGIAPAPAPDVALEDRLGARGAGFTLKELIEDYLLRPLADLGLRRTSNQLHVYTAARFDDAVDFEMPDVRAALAPFLSSLVQIEEPAHAGAPSGTVGVANAILNRRHWAGVGLLGAAHVVADQPPPELPFNEERLRRIMLKYFVPYLLALLQRAVLHRITEDARAIILKPSGPGSEAFADAAAPRNDLFRFAAAGYFTEASSREAVDHYYRIAQEGLRVHNSLNDAWRTTTDLDMKVTAEHQVKLTAAMAQTADRHVAVTEVMARHADLARMTADRQVELAGGMNRHLEIVSGIQMKVEWIEIFLVSVYLAHLGEMIFSHIHGWEEYLWIVVIVGAVVGFLGTMLYLRPWHHKTPAP
jgi:hypothetical protein